MATNNAINLSTAGITGYNGSGTFTGTAVTQYNVIVGGSATDTLANVAPSSTSGVPLISQGSSSNPAFGTAVVAGGGTGAVTFTAYSVICAGTTSTGAFQNVSGVGTSGQVLTSNGASALPSWQSNAGLAWVDVTGTTQTIAVNTGYIADNAGLVTLTLPSTAAQGTVFRVAGNGAGGWTIAQNSGQTINLGSSPTTTGTGGSLSSTNRYDAIECLCTVANDTWVTLSVQGNITVA